MLSVNEVRSVLDNMSSTVKLMAELIYGTGMRVNECVQLRIKDIDFDLKTITVRSGKGAKDRTTMLPGCLTKPLQQHLIQIIKIHKDDCLKGAGFVPLPGALYKKYPKAGCCHIRSDGGVSRKDVGGLYREKNQNARN